MAILNTSILSQWEFINNVSKTVDIKKYVEETVDEITSLGPSCGAIRGDYTINDMTYDGDKYYLATSNGIKISKTGRVIISEIAVREPVTSIKYINGKIFFTVEHGIYILENDQPKLIYSNTNISLKKIDYINNNYIAYGDNYILISNDGQTWSSIETGLIINKIIFINNKYYFATSNGLYSSNIITGISLPNRSHSTQIEYYINYPVYDIAHGSTPFGEMLVVACRENGLKIYSLTYNNIQIESPLYANVVCYINSYFICGLRTPEGEWVAKEPLYYLSFDGQTQWKSIGQLPAIFRGVSLLYKNNGLLFVTTPYQGMGASNGVNLNVINISQLETILFAGNYSYQPIGNYLTQDDINNIQINAVTDYLVNKTNNLSSYYYTKPITKLPDSLETVSNIQFKKLISFNNYILGIGSKLYWYDTTSNEPQWQTISQLTIGNETVNINTIDNIYVHNNNIFLNVNGKTIVNNIQNLTLNILAFTWLDTTLPGFIDIAYLEEQQTYIICHTNGLHILNILIPGNSRVIETGITNQFNSIATLNENIFAAVKTTETLCGYITGKAIPNESSVSGTTDWEIAKRFNSNKEIEFSIIKTIDNIVYAISNNSVYQLINTTEYHKLIEFTGLTKINDIIKTTINGIEVIILATTNGLIITKNNFKTFIIQFADKNIKSITLCNNLVMFIADQLYISNLTNSVSDDIAIVSDLNSVADKLNTTSKVINDIQQEIILIDTLSLHDIEHGNIKIICEKLNEVITTVNQLINSWKK